MSAQAGILYFDGRPVEPHISAGLSARLAAFGPDGRGEYTAPGLVMVHRALHVTPEDRFLSWQQDPAGNHVARLVFPEPASELTVTVDLVADMTVVNPFDFFVEESAAMWPLRYEPDLERDLAARGVRARQQQLQRRFASLSERERQVLALVVQGRMNKQIAADLAIHERTVKLHRTSITGKLGVRSVAELTSLVRESQPPSAQPAL